MSEKAIQNHGAGRHLIFKFYNKLAQVLSFGDEAGGCFQAYLVKFMWGREVIYNYMYLFSKYQMKHNGFQFMASDSQMRRW